MSTPPATIHAGSGMSALCVATQEVREAYARYDPPNMACVGAEYRELPEGIYYFALAVRHLALRSSKEGELPIAPALGMKLADICSMILVTRERSVQVYQNLEKLHGHYIDRLEEPRKGTTNESRWNIAAGQQTDGTGMRRRRSYFAQTCWKVASFYQQVYSPEHMMAVYREYAGMAGAIENIAGTVKQLGDRTRDFYPVYQPVVDAMGEAVNGLYAAASEASGLMPMFRRLHPDDLAYHETPMRNMRMWDV